MMEERVIIFNHIDSEAKYMGFTVLELTSLASIVVSGFVFNSMIFATFGCFGSVVLIRYIQRYLKASACKRMAFYFASHLLANAKRLNIYARYYI